MNICLDMKLKQEYKSSSQIARIVTESWVVDNMYCPRCGNVYINRFPNNAPVADFFCPKCSNQFELKSKSGKFGRKIADGAYETMISRITSNENPDFFFMNYSKEDSTVVNFLFVSKYFFVPNIIEKRNPLSDDARRAGWVGCNILVDRIPSQGVVAIVEDGRVISPRTVLAKVEKGQRLATKDIKARGWLLDILNCVNKILYPEFTLTDIYGFEDALFKKHPLNNNVKAKIRQQLQLLRDKGFIEFLGNGAYRKKEV